MSISKRLGVSTVLIGLALVATACSGGGTESTTTLDPSQSEFPFGSPADRSDADRTVEIAATDSLVFDPAEVTVAPGETITFRIVNTGSLIHDFTLGDQAAQDEHEAEMRGMEGMAHDAPNVVTVAVGETSELTWTFSETGTVLIGCHQLGHYDAGMKGQVIVGR